MMSRATSDVAAMQELMSSGLMTVLGNIFGLSFVVFWLFQDWVMAISPSGSPCTRLGMSLWQKSARGLFEPASYCGCQFDDQRDVSGVRVIQSLSREDENSKRFGSVNNMNLAANISAARLSAMVVPMVEMTVAVATRFVLSLAVFAFPMAGCRVLETLLAFVLYIHGSSTRFATWCCSTRNGNVLWRRRAHHRSPGYEAGIVDAPDAVGWGG